ncbi:MAG: phytoene desaturase family protein [Saprospiraceae bacterium]|nr:phytoene desaturase family protein [Saprospiraceae bacterium]
MEIGIVGAGIAGLAASIRAAVAGHKVTVFEVNSYPGGKLTAFEKQGYRFDAGPSLFTMPQYVDDLFILAGENPADHFKYIRLDPVCNYFWEDGTTLSAHADKKKFSNEAAQKLNVPADYVMSSLQDSADKYEANGRIFLEKSLHRWSTWLNMPVFKALLKIHKYDLFSSINRVNERLVKHPKLVQLFNRFATYNGSDPYRAPGLLTIIPHFEHHIGAFYPENGMHSITKAVYELAIRLGVTFHFNTRVEEILTKNKVVNGLRTEEKTYPFDRIICNMDVFFAYKKLLPNHAKPNRILQQERSTSAIIFYWGIKKVFPQLAMHNLFFSDDYRSEFKHLKEGKVAKDVSIYVNLTTDHTPSDAPEGCQNWFVMINVPSQSAESEPLDIDALREQAIAKLSRMLGEQIKPLIEMEEILSPQEIESRTQSHQGSLYGTASNKPLSAFLRHPNFSNEVKGLYFCGGSVHPGGGIPLCLLSAKIAVELL